MPPRHPMHTYSIVACDPATGEIGIGVQSHWFCVGASVVWAEAGVGVMAVQADAEPAYGSEGLSLLGQGLDAEAALARLVETGPRSQTQQLALLDCRGGVAAHTGRDCIPFAGHQLGASRSAQANMMLRAGTWQAMLAGFEAAGGSLGQRLLAALHAGEAQGGDLRGRQSAALVVVRTTATGDRRRDRPVDLRVDDHADPLAELSRLFTMRIATDLANLGFEHLWSGDHNAAVTAFESAARRAPRQLEFAFWLAWSLLAAGREAAAVEVLQPVLRVEPGYRLLLERLATTEGRRTGDGLMRLLESRQ